MQNSVGRLFKMRQPRQRTAAGRLVLALERHRIDCVIDVGGNEGQTGSALLKAGWAGRIVSFEPVAAAHRDLERAASRAGNWTVAPRMALGAENGEIEINVGLTHNWSSIRAVRDETVRIRPKSRTVARECVPLRRLDGVLTDFAAPKDRLFVKIDTQGYEGEILAGAAGAMDRIHGFQLELCLAPLYESEETYERFFAWMGERGFELWMVESASFSAELARQTHFDAIFFRRSG